MKQNRLGGLPGDNPVGPPCDATTLEEALAVWASIGPDEQRRYNEAACRRRDAEMMAQLAQWQPPSLTEERTSELDAEVAAYFTEKGYPDTDVALLTDAQIAPHVTALRQAQAQAERDRIRFERDVFPMILKRVKLAIAHAEQEVDPDVKGRLLEDAARMLADPKGYGLKRARTLTIETTVGRPGPVRIRFPELIRLRRQAAFSRRVRRRDRQTVCVSSARMPQARRREPRPVAVRRASASSTTSSADPGDSGDSDGPPPASVAVAPNERGHDDRLRGDFPAALIVLRADFADRELTDAAYRAWWQQFAGWTAETARQFCAWSPVDPFVDDEGEDWR